MKLPKWIESAAAKRMTCLLPLLASLFLWLPAINAPFWQDDYFYIFNSNIASAANEPFWASLWPQNAPNSWNWRPLSQEMYWRFVVAGLNADPKLAHLFNVALLYCAALSFGLFAYAYSKLAKWPEPTWIAVLCAGLYAVAQFNFMPVYWVSAANGSILAALTFLALLTFLRFEQADSAWKRVQIGALLLLISVISLLVKESAVLLPGLCFLVWFSLGYRWKNRGALFSLLMAFVLAAALWWVVRSRFVLPTPPEYGLQFSTNVIRNLAAQVAWLLNVPRESIRLLTIGQSGWAALWIAMTAAPILAAVIYTGSSSKGLVGIRKLSASALFAVVAYAPYYFFGWNSYEYYASISAALLLLLFGRCICALRASLIPVVLIVVSSLFGVIGNQLVAYPALIARAQWAEITLLGLEQIGVKAPLVVNAQDEHRFSAIRQEGLIWRLKIGGDQISFAKECNPESLQMLIVDDAGGVLLEDCKTHSRAMIVSP